MSCDELIELARHQADRLAEQDAVIARQDAQIAALSTQLADVMDRFEEVSAKLARVEHLLSRNNDNSNFPSSKDDGVGGTAPSRKERRAAGRAKGKRPGAEGGALQSPGRLTAAPRGRENLGAGPPATPSVSWDLSP